MNTQLKRLVVAAAASAALVLPVSTAHAAPADQGAKQVKVVKVDRGIAPGPGATTQRIDWE